MKLLRGHYGNAILSRFPLTDVRHVDLTVPLKKRRRALIARCRLGARKRESVLLVNFHLGLAEFERGMQLRRLLEEGHLDHADERSPLVVAGDYNDVWGTLGPRFMGPAGFRSAAGVGEAWRTA